MCRARRRSRINDQSANRSAAPQSHGFPNWNGSVTRFLFLSVFLSFFLFLCLICFLHFLFFYYPTWGWYLSFVPTAHHPPLTDAIRQYSHFQSRDGIIRFSFFYRLFLTFLFLPFFLCGGWSSGSNKRDDTVDESGEWEKREEENRKRREEGIDRNLIGPTCHSIRPAEKGEHGSRGRPTRCRLDTVKKKRHNRDKK